jgi:hypothetical protein
VNASVSDLPVGQAEPQHPPGQLVTDDHAEHRVPHLGLWQLVERTADPGPPVGVIARNRVTAPPAFESSAEPKLDPNNRLDGLAATRWTTSVGPDLANVLPAVFYSGARDTTSPLAKRRIKEE